MEYTEGCDRVLKALEVTLMVRGLHRANLTVEELSKRLGLGAAVVHSILHYLEIWQFVSCQRDAMGTITQASITLEGSRAITRGILMHGA